MLCFVGAMTLVGLVIMIRSNCHFKVQCCITCKEEERTDFNLDYGTYYYDDGERRTDVVEVSFVVFIILPLNLLFFRQGTTILITTTTTIQRVTCTMLSQITIPSITHDVWNFLQAH